MGGGGVDLTWPLLLILHGNPSPSLLILQRRRILYVLVGVENHRYRAEDRHRSRFCVFDLFNLLVERLTTLSVAQTVWRQMINRGSWYNLKFLPTICLDGLRGNHEKSQLVLPVSAPRLESRWDQILKRNLMKQIFFLRCGHCTRHFASS